MLSLWRDGAEVAPRQQLAAVIDADVAIVGAGFTGLWTAYYLLQLAPQLKIAIVEARHVGFGGSGRNGGWCVGFLPMSPSEMAIDHGVEPMQFIQKQLFTTVDEVGEVTAREKIDCGFHKGGTIETASNLAHVDRIKETVSSWRSAGFGEQDMRWENADEIRSRISLPTTFGGKFSPHCAAINPWQLVTGLARVLESRGVSIYEDSPALALDSRRVTTGGGAVNAKWVVRAIESFGSQMKPTHRSVVPLYSLMVATEPLSESVWQSLGWENRETFSDGRNMITYGQRTADGRIAFGGRGAPYHFGSRIADRYDHHKTIHRRLENTVRELFPQIGDAEFTHRWGGPVGAPRDWHAYANVDRDTGMCAGGGYVGDGVALSNLVGRTLAHQIADTGDALTRSLLVNHQSKQWEPEPLRWLGVNSLLALTELADRVERRTHRPTKRLLALRDRLLG